MIKVGILIDRSKSHDEGC